MTYVYKEYEGNIKTAQESKWGIFPGGGTEQVLS